MFIFIDESGSTNRKAGQKFLVVSFILMSNRQFVEDLIIRIKDRCKSQGQPINKRELSYHSLTPFQREIAVQAINLSYRNFYVCFFDVEKASREIVTGRHEQRIQMQSIHDVLSKLDKTKLLKSGTVKVIMDPKLKKKFQRFIEEELQRHLGTKKGISVVTTGSARERGIQLADLIAGAFRASLMKKSGLFQVDDTHIFQIIADDMNHFSTENI